MQWQPSISVGAIRIPQRCHDMLRKLDRGPTRPRTSAKHNLPQSGWSFHEAYTALQIHVSRAVVAELSIRFRNVWKLLLLSKMSFVSEKWKTVHWVVQRDSNTSWHILNGVGWFLYCSNFPFVYLGNYTVNRESMAIREGDFSPLASLVTPLQSTYDCTESC